MLIQLPKKEKNISKSRGLDREISRIILHKLVVKIQLSCKIIEKFQLFN
jgi:hypothetical protein